MKKLKDVSFAALAELPGFDIDKMRIQQRIEDIYVMWETIVEPVIVQHTNALYIFEENGVTYLHAYMDESIFAADLNARREIIKAQFMRQFKEKIDVFEIHISKGKRKKDHPFEDRKERRKKKLIPVPLTDEEEKEVETTTEVIGDEEIRAAFMKAMKSDLELKKASDK